MKDLISAKQKLSEGEYTCVFYRDDQCFTSQDRGIRPLLAFLDAGLPAGFCAADKVVGRGAALLYCLLQVKQVYAQVISADALKILCAHNIAVEYDSLTDAILNRRKEDLCPIEKATAGITCPQEGLPVIRQALKTLS